MKYDGQRLKSGRWKGSRLFDPGAKVPVEYKRWLLRASYDLSPELIVDLLRDEHKSLAELLKL